MGVTFPSLEGQGMIAIDVETRDPDLKTRGPGYHRDGYLVGVSVGTEAGFRKYYPIAHEGGANMDRDQVLSWLRPQLALPIPKVGANLMYDLGFLRAAGVPVSGPYYDIQVAEPLLCESRLSYSLEALSQAYLGEGKKDDEMEAFLIEHFGKKDPKSNIWRAPGDVVAKYAEGDVDLPLRIFAKQKQKLEEENLWDLFILESKLIPMLLDMRFRGIRVDLDKAQEMYDALSDKQASELREIEAIASAKVSPWNAKDLALVFDALGLEYPRTPKTKAPSFTALWLERCEYPVAKKILEVRKMDKLRETFLKGCLLDSHYKGRIHCQFHPLKTDGYGAISGRFSCVAPWTPVVTRRGVIPISQVQIGDEVFTHRRRWRKVLHTWLKGREQMFDVYLSNGQKLTCTGKHRVYIQELDEEAREHRGRPGVMLNAKSKRDSQETQYDPAQCFRRIEGLIDDPRATSYVLVESFSVEGGRQKPYEGKVVREASQLEGDIGREERVSNYTDREGENPLSSTCDAEFERLRDTPHRRKSEEQSPGQSCNSNTEGSSDDTYFTEARSEVVTIKKIEACGDYEVYDITVEEDESYLACGVFSHNSSNPNLQFIPTRTDDGKLIRSMFLPDEDQDLYSIDYSQIEYRLMAHDAYTHKLPGAAEVVERYRSDSGVDFHQIVAEMTGLSRSAAKTVNFGIAYGEGAAKLCASLGLTEAEGRNLLDEYHRRAPFMRPLSKRASHLAATSGVITTLLGRKRRFDAWAVTDRNGDTRILHKHIPGAKRAFTHKALNARIQGSAADIMKKAMVDIYESGVCDVIGVPQITVHDELVGSVPRTKEGFEAYGEMKRLMEDTVKLAVPLTVDGKIGSNWKECK